MDLLNTENLKNANQSKTLYKLMFYYCCLQCKECNGAIVHAKLLMNISVKIPTIHLC